MNEKEAREMCEELKNKIFSFNKYMSNQTEDEIMQECWRDIKQVIENQQLELEKKDKIIDLMARAIGNEPLPTEEYCIFRNFDCPVVGGNRDCKECVKQYFERKVKEDK